MRRLELRAAPALHFGEDLIYRQSLPIGAIAGHGVERIGNGDDARGERNCGAGQAIRIALTVPALVVVKHGIATGSEVGEAADQPSADLGVRTHLLPLFLFHGGFFEERRRANADLANIVHAGCHEDLLSLLPAVA